MLLILMYHRVHGVGLGPDTLRQHLQYLADRHPIVWPGDPLPRRELSVCITFDDATVDFYQEVYPLLDKLDLKAMVAVPTSYIEQDTSLIMQDRLMAQNRVIMSGDYATEGCPLCTWTELRQMQAGGRVQCASHGHGHADLSAADADLETELGLSRKLLSDQTGQIPQCFVFPYGNTNRVVNRRVLREYRYAMRIGTALNLGWGDNGGLLYRVDAENFWPQGKVWSLTDQISYRLKYMANRLRNK